MKGNIFDIKRFAVHDGPGIRTTVFFKGCPLRCVWCHNPEGLSAKPQLAYYAHKCVGCGGCVLSCPAGAHTLDTEHIHRFEREKCLSCGKCVSACYNGALSLFGRTVTVEELLPELTADRDFYEASGGGITLSGGECLLQADFCAALLARLKAEGLATAVDTCGFVPQEAFDKVLPYTDLFLYDIKAIDEDVHLRCTGHSNKCILENLRYLQSCGKAVEIRVPYVPGFNDGQKEKILNFLKAFSNIVRIRILPYHNYAATKYKALGLADALPPTLPEKREIDEFQALAVSLYKKA